MLLYLTLKHAHRFQKIPILIQRKIKILQIRVPRLFYRVILQKNKQEFFPNNTTMLQDNPLNSEKNFFLENLIQNNFFFNSNNFPLAVFERENVSGKFVFLLIQSVSIH